MGTVLEMESSEDIPAMQRRACVIEAALRLTLCMQLSTLSARVLAEPPS